VATKTFTAGSVLTSADVNTYCVTVQHLLVEYTFPSANTALTLSGIPSTYKHLLLVGIGRGTALANSIEANLTFNNDSGANYSRLSWDASDTAATPTGAWSSDRTSVEAFIFAGDSLSTFSAGSGSLLIPDYADTNWYKSVISNSAAFTSDTGILARERRMFWKSTAAINRIDLTASSGNFYAGTRFSLYGLG